MKIVIYSLNDVVTKFIYQLEENCHWYIKWHSKDNTTKSYTNFVLQKVALKDEEHIYAYHRIIHKFCITKIAPQRWGKTYIHIYCT